MDNNSIRILIVEDNMIIAANISMQLTNLGYDVVGIVAKGEEAVSIARESKIDILLLDIQLRGDINGIDAARIIRKFCEISIVFLTANGDTATFEQAKETGPSAFITKPFNKLNLQRTIALVVEKLKQKKVNLVLNP